MKPSILITGAYGGMGKATANALADRGFRVFALDRTVGDGSDIIIPKQLGRISLIISCVHRKFPTFYETGEHDDK